MYSHVAGNRLIIIALPPGSSSWVQVPGRSVTASIEELSTLSTEDAELLLHDAPA